MIILDTNVISEMARPRPDAHVVAWLQSLTQQVSITAVTLAELLAGLRRLPEGYRKNTVTGAVESVLASYRASRVILPFDDEAASEYADVLHTRQMIGQPISTADAQIAAICRVHGATCATRNTKDFLGTGITVVNPWHETS